MAKRKVNEFYEAAVEITAISNPHPARRENVLAMNLKHLSKLCGKGAIEYGVEPYNVRDVVECWTELRLRLIEAGLSEPSILAVVTPEGGKQRIKKWIEERLESIPPVYDEAAHDDYVRDHAEFLSRHAFVYQATDLPGRLTKQDLIELGLEKTDDTSQLSMFA
jgi:hypothetical protein